MMILFWIAAVVAVVSTILALTRLDGVHALLYLIVALMAMALVFLTLGAPFIGSVEPAL